MCHAGAEVGHCRLLLHVPEARCIKVNLIPRGMQAGRGYRGRMYAGKVWLGAGGCRSDCPHCSASPKCGILKGTAYFSYFEMRQNHYKMKHYVKMRQHRSKRGKMWQ